MFNLNNKKLKIAIFFNSHRGFKVYKNLSQKFDLEIYLCKKNLDFKIKEKLNLMKKNFNLVKKIDENLVRKISKKKYFLIISAGCPYIFPKNLICSAKRGSINLHAGPLPNYRGGSPLNWQIINGEKNIGISVIEMTSKLDAGPIYDSFKFKLKKNDNIRKVHKRVNKIFPLLTVSTIKKILNNKKPILQSKKNLRLYRQRKDEDGLIKWNKLDNIQVYNFVRGITKPYPGAYYFKNKKKIRVYKCKISKRSPNITPGTQFVVNNKNYIKCRKFSIEL